MRSVVSFLLFAIVRALLVGRQVRAAPEQSGGLGHAATSLCAELISPNGYSCSEHRAVTQDGFILGLQNIPSPRGVERPSYGRPVLLQHGLSAGGDHFVDNGPQQSLAFVLADAGFDVWIGNSRTIQWSHGHKTLFPNESAYWAWTDDELASYDLLAITEFVSSARGGVQIGYIGHSLGTTMIFAGLTGGRFRNEILGYLNAVVLLAPIALSSHQTAPVLVATLLEYSTLDPETTPASEYSTYNETVAICGPPAGNLSCYAALTDSLGPQSYIDPSLLSFYTQYFPQPTSTYNYNHLGQGFVRDNFAFYDEGTEENLAKYGQATPPNYDLTTFPACLPVQYWIGGIDTVADPIDAAAILAQLPSSNREVNTLSNYGHFDFILGTHAYIDLYPNIITYLNKHEVSIYCPPPSSSPSPSPSPTPLPHSPSSSPSPSPSPTPSPHSPSSSPSPSPTPTPSPHSPSPSLSPSPTPTPSPHSPSSSPSPSPTPTPSPHSPSSSPSPSPTPTPSPHSPSSSPSPSPSLGLLSGGRSLLTHSPSPSPTPSPHSPSPSPSPSLALRSGVRSLLTHSPSPSPTPSPHSPSSSPSPSPSPTPSPHSPSSSPSPSPTPTPSPYSPSSSPSPSPSLGLLSGGRSLLTHSPSPSPTPSPHSPSSSPSPSPSPSLALRSGVRSLLTHSPSPSPTPSPHSPSSSPSPSPSPTPSPHSPSSSPSPSPTPTPSPPCPPPPSSVSSPPPPPPTL